MFKQKNLKKTTKKEPRYITRKVYYLIHKAPGVKVQDVNYLEKPKKFDPFYSVPLKYKKPSRIAGRTPRNRISVVVIGYIPVPPIITLKFPSDFTPFLDIKEEGDEESILGF